MGFVALAWHHLSPCGWKTAFTVNSDCSSSFQFRSSLSFVISWFLPKPLNLLPVFWAGPVRLFLQTFVNWGALCRTRTYRQLSELKIWKAVVIFNLLNWSKSYISLHSPVLLSFGPTNLLISSSPLHCNKKGNEERKSFALLIVKFPWMYVYIWACVEQIHLSLNSKVS